MRLSPDGTSVVGGWPWEPPQGPYGETVICRMFRACERFGIHPREIDAWEPGFRRLMLDNEAYRQWQESAQLALLVGARAHQ